MSQKSNMLTIRFPDKSINLNIENCKEFISIFTISKNLKRSLEKKEILISKIASKTENSHCTFTFDAFFKTRKLLKYKKFIHNQIVKKKTSNPAILESALGKIKKYNSISLKINILNLILENEILRAYFFFIKKYKNILFNRQFTLFIDFIKLTNLFIKKKISAEIYVQLLGKVFKALPKSKHSKYFLFIKQLFTAITEDNNSLVKGLKLKISGKLKGKLRSSSEVFNKGKIATQTIETKLDYAQVHVYTIYGVFGLKLWTTY